MLHAVQYNWCCCALLCLLLIRSRLHGATCGVWRQYGLAAKQRWNCAWRMSLPPSRAVAPVKLSDLLHASQQQQPVFLHGGAGRSVILTCGGQRTMRTCLDGAARLTAAEVTQGDFKGASAAVVRLRCKGLAERGWRTCTLKFIKSASH